MTPVMDASEGGAKKGGGPGEEDVVVGDAGLNVDDEKGHVRRTNRERCGRRGVMGGRVGGCPGAAGTGA